MLSQVDLVNVAIVSFPKRAMGHNDSSPGGGGALPSNGLLGICRWMGSHFHDSTDFHGVAFSNIFNRVTRMGSHIFGTLSGKKIICPKVTKMGFIIGHKIDQK